MNPIFIALAAVVMFALGIAAAKFWQRHAADEETLALRGVIKAAEKVADLKKLPTAAETEAAAATVAKLEALRLRAKSSIDALF